MAFEEMSNEELRAELARLQRERADASTQADERQRLVHELQVHQVELEAQNRELREAQDALEDSRHRFADLYDFAPVAYVTFNRQGLVLEINLTGAAMLGRDRSRLIGAPFLQLVEMADPSQFWEHLRLSAQSRGPTMTALTFAPRGRAQGVFQVTSVPQLDAAERVIALRTSFADVTARKRLEDDLRRAHEKEQQLARRFESLDAAVVAMSGALARLADPTDLFKTIVEQARLLTGADFAALGVGVDPSAPFSPWIQTGVDAEARAAMSGPPRPVGLLGVVARAGRVVNVSDIREHPAFSGFPPGHPEMGSFLGVPITYGGKSLGHLYVARRAAGEGFDDAAVSAALALARRMASPLASEGFSKDAQRMVEMLAQRAGTAMEISRLNEVVFAALRAREELLQIVAHDLRNPLWGIRLNAQALKVALSANPSQMDEKAVDALLSAASLMDGLIDDLLQSSEIEAGTFALETAPIPAQPLVAELSSAMQPMAASRSIALEVAVAADLPAIQGDRKRVLQVLSNLLGNALKFTPPGGRVGVAVIREGDDARFSVSDSGPGIPEEHLTHVFDRYWKGSGDDRRGLGLGLSIAKGIVLAHGGHVGVTSTLGAGATFWFTVPIAKDG